MLEDEAEIVNPPKEATAAVIWLHGLGADGHDFVPVVPQLGLNPNHSIRFIFPHAPLRPVTLNNGMMMRAWYDIYSLDAKMQEDEVGIRATALEVARMIEVQKKAGIPSSRIILAGFSQGGAMALYYGLRSTEKLGGILALSTYLPLATTLLKEKALTNQHIPIFMAHGLYDTLLPYVFGNASKDYLLQLGYPLKWQSYPMEHSVCLQEIEDIGRWLTDILCV